jgi:hypothetical protein
LKAKLNALPLKAKRAGGRKPIFVRLVSDTLSAIGQLTYLFLDVKLGGY